MYNKRAGDENDVYVLRLVKDMALNSNFAQLEAAGAAAQGEEALLARGTKDRDGKIQRDENEPLDYIHEEVPLDQLKRGGERAASILQRKEGSEEILFISYSNVRIFFLSLPII